MSRGEELIALLMRLQREQDRAVVAVISGDFVRARVLFDRMGVQAVEGSRLAQFEPKPARALRVVPGGRS